MKTADSMKTEPKIKLTDNKLKSSVVCRFVYCNDGE